MLSYFLFAIPVIFLIVSVIMAIKSVKKGGSKKRALAIQMLSFFAVSIICFSSATITHAASTESSSTSTSTSNSAAMQADVAKATNGMAFLAMAASVGLAGIGGGIAVAAAAPAAIGATSEDPKAFGKALIFVALGESIAIYGLVIAILIFSKLISV